jgi:lipopolysaccharide transport system ATP-binding protein
MRSDLAVSVSDLTKTYRIFGHPGDRIKQALTFGRKRYHREFTALEGVSFEVRKGETVGIIGPNGSGKSTLLQLVCGILKPTAGKVEVDGRIAALLELGSGFNPEFTGRENVYFQGAVLGMKKEEMSDRFADIAAFADIGEFIDQPVRTYSSGMFVRLAFAVAVHVDPRILVVDEALAVGDAKFQSKCFQRIKAFQKDGGSILLVTHSLEQVGHFCDRALLLDRGTLVADGSPAQTLTSYSERIAGNARIESASGSSDSFSSHRAYNPNETRWGDRAAVVTDICLAQEGVRDPATFHPGVETEVTLRIEYHAAVERPVYGLTVKSSDGALIFTTNSLQSPAIPKFRAQGPGDVVRARFSFQPFLDAGEYSISVGVISETQHGIVVHDRRYDAISFRIGRALTPSGEVAVRPSFCILD